MPKDVLVGEAVVAKEVEVVEMEMVVVVLELVEDEDRAMAVDGHPQQEIPVVEAAQTILLEKNNINDSGMAMSRKN